jgi:curved DNA-binding protein CbpA
MKNYFAGVTNFEELRKNYKRLALENHPDRGGNLEAMQEINAQYDKLFKELKDVHNQEADADTSGKKRHMNETPEAYREAIIAVMNIEGIVIELCGSWLWLSGNTFKNKEAIKKAGFDWSKNKKMWYWHPAEETTKFYRGKSTMDKIRKTWGSEIISTYKPELLPT